MQSTITWIPCSERLPESERECQVTCGGVVRTCFHRKVDAPDVWCNRFGDAFINITHWAELPAPPEDS